VVELLVGDLRDLAVVGLEDDRDLVGLRLRWRSRQFLEALSSPSWNHLKKGAFDSSSVLVNGLSHMSSFLACFAQKPSKSRSASAHIALYAASPGCWRASAARRRREDAVSWRTDSMVDMAFLSFFCVGKFIARRKGPL
jgi:hypothetical protein